VTQSSLPCDPNVPNHDGSILAASAVMTMVRRARAMRKRKAIDIGVAATGEALSYVKDSRTKLVM
jgi:hypothetical protein